MPRYVKVAAADEIQPGECKLVEVEGARVALYNVGGTIHATDDTCTHAGGPLSEGFLDGKLITCPWHGARFDVTCGVVQGPPAMQNVESYPTRVEEGQVEVEI